MEAEVWEWLSVLKSAVVVWLRVLNQMIHSRSWGVAHGVLALAGGALYGLVFLIYCYASNRGVSNAPYD